LKLFTSPRRRRSTWIWQHHRAGTEVPSVMTYVVRRLKPKLLVLSRLARSTCCQRSVRIIHLSGSVLDRGRMPV